MLTTLRHCLALVPPAMRPRWAALVPVVLLTAAFEAAGAAAVFGLIRLLTNPEGISDLPVASTIVAMLPPLDARTTTVLFTVLVGLFYVVKNLLAVASARAKARCVHHSTAATSEILVRRYLDAPWSYHLRRNSADLVHGAHQAVQRVYTMVMAPALTVLTELLVGIGIVSVLLAAAPGVTLVAVSILLGLSWSFLRLTRRATVRLGTALDSLSADTLHRLQQGLGAVKELKVLGRTQAFADDYGAGQRALATSASRYAMLSALPRLVVETVFVCGALFVVVLLSAGGATTTDAVPLLGLYAYAGFRVIPSANRILWLTGEIRYGSSIVERVYNDLAELPTTTTETTSECSFEHRLTFENVWYAHGRDGEPVLREVNLELRRGESLGLMGETGAGKSTLLDLAIGLLEPTKGRITVDGADLSTCVSAWQREIGYVPQSVFIKNDTLRRNIALGVADQDVDEARVVNAVRCAQLESFVARLPEGLETRVGESAIGLSGGERQRLGIARALYAGPRVLVLDEATSSLDAATEAALIDGLDVLHGEVTMLIVAHRPPSLMHCDRIAVMRDGRVVDVGAYEELAARSREFRALAAIAEAT